MKYEFVGRVQCSSSTTSTWKHIATYKIEGYVHKDRLTSKHKLNVGGGRNGNSVPTFFISSLFFFLSITKAIF